jgi:cytosine/adenosine deaminase-related metal-dependent hydrolase
MTNLTILNVHRRDEAASDIYIADGMVVADPAPGADVLDANGALALPAFVDAHMHLDKTLWGLPWRAHSAGKSLSEKIANERRARSDLGADTAAQAAKLIAQAHRCGTAAIRSHVDVDPDLGLGNVEALLAVRADHAESVDIQLVAFPQTGLVSRPGTPRLMEDAIRLGVDLIGGIDPEVIDGDAAGHIRTIFEMAERTGAGIDIHHHEEGDPGADTLDLILDAVAAHGMQGLVTISHGFCIGMVDTARMERLLDRIAELDVSVITAAPGYKPFPPLDAMHARNIRAGAGSDGVRDVWTPYGNADMLERAMLMAYRSNYRGDDELSIALDMCCGGSASVMGLTRHGTDIGNRADIVLIQAENAAHAVVARPDGRTLIKGGRVIAESA